MKFPLVLLVVLGLLAPAAIAGDYCREARRARRNPANDAKPVAVQGPVAALVTDDGTTASEHAGRFADAVTAVRPGPQASTSVGDNPSAGAGLVAQARGGTISSPKQRADREIRRVIRRLH